MVLTIKTLKFVISRIKFLIRMPIKDRNAGECGNTLPRGRPWSKVIRFESLSEVSVLDRPSSGTAVTPGRATGMTDAVWTVKVLLSSDVPRDFHARLDQ